MELVPIFVKDSTSVEGVFAVRYTQGQPDEFERLFDKWSDANEVFSYLLFNEEYLKDPFFDEYTIDDLANRIHIEVLVMQEFFLKYVADSFSVGGNTLQSLFKPLESDKKQFSSEVLQRAKLFIDEAQSFPQPILRFYGLRISENTFIITGGSIKLTHFMKDHPDTRDELEKLELVKNWLIENEVVNQDDIDYSYHEQ